MLLNPSFAGLLAPATTRDQREVEGYNHHAESVSIDDCTPGNWEAIVTEDQVRAVRARLTDSARATNTGQTARKWLLGGLATCSVCRVPVRSARTREGHHGYRCPAGHFLRRGEVIDAFVVAGVLKRLSEPDAETLLQPPPPDIDVPALHARREALQAKRAELLKLVGTFTAAQVEQETVPIDAELDDIAVTLAKVMEADPLAEILSAPDLLAFWRGLSLARQRDIVDALAMVVIAPVGKGRKMDSFGAVATSVLLDWHSNPGAGVLASDGPMTDETFDALRSALG
jgi:hypothetical protein